MALVALCLYCGVAGAVLNYTPGLRYDFYKNSCPRADDIVFEQMTEIFKTKPTAQDGDFGKNVAPDLLRLHFHDCFVRGCEGSVLMDKPGSEKTAPPNGRLEGFDAVDKIKAALEGECPGTVSCADLLAFAARDGVRLTGGFFYRVPAGRRDGYDSIAAEATKNLPDPRMNVDQLTLNFKNQGLTRDEMVILSGAHTIGDVACHHIDNRLYTYPGNNGVDPSLPRAFVKKLKGICPRPNLFDITVDMDQVTPIRFDSQYYKNLASKTSVLSSDQVLYDDVRTRPLVRVLESKLAFLSKFGPAMVRMGNINVLTGNQGEVRLNCRRKNSPGSA